MKSGNGYKISCPVPGHDDRHPSAEVGDLDDGGIWIKCYSRCGSKAPWHALKDMGYIEQKAYKKAKYTFAECEKKLAGHWIYKNVDGSIHSQAKRFDMTAPDGTPAGKTYIRLNAYGKKPGPGFKYILLHLPEVVQAAKDGRVILELEGENKAELIMSLGLVGTSFIGGCKSIKDWLASEPWQHMKGCDMVALIPDHDQEGWLFVQQKAAAYHEHGIPVRIVPLPGLPVGDRMPKDNGLDIREWIQAYNHTVDELKEAIAAAPDYMPTPEFKEAAQNNTVVELFPLDSERVLSETYAAEVFLEEQKDALHYVNEQQQWYVFNGQILTPDLNAGKVHRLCQMTLDKTLPKHILKERVDPLRGRRWIASLKNKAAIRSVVSIAQWHKGISIDDLDVEPMIINLKNGVYDFRTGQLKPHKGSDMLTKMAAFSYVNKGACKQWLEYLNWVFQGDAELILYNQIWAGYCLTGMASEQKIRINHGKGGNGKSVDSNTRMRLAGTYSSVVPSSAFLRHQRETQLDSLSQLKGLRHAVLSEIPKGAQFDDAKIKDVSGGDKLKVRYLFGEPQPMDNQCKLEFRTNYKPGSSTDDGMHRRLQIVPYNAKIDGPQRKDLDLKFIAEEGDQIGMWMLAGAHLYLEMGLIEPEAIKIENLKYRTEIDLVGQFKTAWLESDPDAHTEQKYLHQFYKKWSHTEGFDTVYSPKTLASELERLGCTIVQGNTGRFLKGVRVKPIIEVKHGDKIDAPEEYRND